MSFCPKSHQSQRPSATLLNYRPWSLKSCGTKELITNCFFPVIPHLFNAEDGTRPQANVVTRRRLNELLCSVCGCTWMTGRDETWSGPYNSGCSLAFPFNNCFIVLLFSNPLHSLSHIPIDDNASTMLSDNYSKEPRNSPRTTHFPGNLEGALLDAFRGNGIRRVN